MLAAIQVFTPNCLNLRSTPHRQKLQMRQGIEPAYAKTGLDFRAMARASWLKLELKRKLEAAP